MTKFCPRRSTKKIFVGNVDIGGDAPIRVQSMTNTITEDIDGTTSQIKKLEKVGCELVRVAVNSKEAAHAIPFIKEKINIPLIADIHFDYRLAILAVENGADGIRINPGNIGSENKLDKIIEACAKKNIPIRLGVNSGSLEKDLLKKYNGPVPEAMVESAIRWIAKFEKRNFYNLKISLKSSSVMDTILAYTEFSKRSDYPLHVGITEAGPYLRGTVKSSVGIGILLSRGIGDTIRVSLTGDPEKEVIVAWEILRSLELRKRGPEIISCPTCGRTKVNILRIVQEVEEFLKGIEYPFKVAIMGCVVNGPGEAKEADIGIAGGENLGVIFKKGKVIKKVYGEDNLIMEFKTELSKYISQLNKGCNR